MSEELIRRSDAIKAMQYSNLDTLNTEERVALVNVIPTIEPKRGEWIDLNDKWGFESTFKCSACGVLWSLMDGTPQDNGMNFCPNCGADMRGKER